MVIPVIISVAFLVFFIVNLAPGDPARLVVGREADEATIERVREELGLNENIFLRFGKYILNMLRGDLGTSYYSDKPVLEAYFERFPATMTLAFWTVVIGMVVSLPLGIISAVKQYSWIDNFGMVFALLAVSMPNFWLGILLILLFSLELGILPSGGYQGWYSVILPAATIGMQMFAVMTRMTRSSMLEVIRQDYIKTARAKGLSEWVVILRHAFKNALIPIITTIGTMFISMVCGAVVIEQVFAWPGVGRLILDAISKRDFPVVIGSVTLTTIVVCVVNLFIDILYGFVDPRIKASYSNKG
jgi:peptide/nickel transport system permease protein